MNKYTGDCENGYGTLTYPSGVKYEGDWKDNMKHGSGIYTTPDGQKYVGEWKDDLKHG